MNKFSRIFRSTKQDCMHNNGLLSYKLSFQWARSDILITIFIEHFYITIQPQLKKALLTDILFKKKCT